tara:strand:+ start:2782 stop:3318 length:537 start_codon:yes stop_codon:yes gene_type:complete
MAILSKGYTFTSTDTVTSIKLNNVVDLATFADGCVDDTSTALVGGQIIVKNGGITPTKLSTGGPTWTSGGDLTVGSGGNFICGGTLTTGGTISSSNDIQASAGLTSNTYLQVDGISTLTGNATFLGSIVAHGTATGRTVPLQTASATPNAISFGWDGANNYLLVKIDANNYRVTLTAV